MTGDGPLSSAPGNSLLRQDYVVFGADSGTYHRCLLQTCAEHPSGGLANIVPNVICEIREQEPIALPGFTTEAFQKEISEEPVRLLVIRIADLLATPGRPA